MIQRIMKRGYCLSILRGEPLPSIKSALQNTAAKEQESKTRM